MLYGLELIATRRGRGRIFVTEEEVMVIDGLIFGSFGTG
jgi:hypothetical protein